MHSQTREMAARVKLATDMVRAHPDNSQLAYELGQALLEFGQAIEEHEIYGTRWEDAVWAYEQAERLFGAINDGVNCILAYLLQVNARAQQQAQR